MCSGKVFTQRKKHKKTLYIIIFVVVTLFVLYKICKDNLPSDNIESSAQEDSIKKNQVNIYYDSALYYSKADRYDKALNCFDIIIWLNPTDDAFFRRANIKSNMQNYSGAIEDYSRAIELVNKKSFLKEFDMAKYYDCRGKAKFMLKKYLEAKEDFDKAIECLPDEELGFFGVEYLLDKGKAEYMLGLYSNAINVFTMVIALKPEYGISYYWRGRVEYELKNYSYAILDFNKAVEIDSINAETIYARAMAKIKTYDHSGACKDLQLAFKLGHSEAGNVLNQYCK
ncbi:MAG TPA: tetratricopeptide repeat protein [Bacteroidales bacterium]|nr:tetratricopeptide repeat protein [Bacteroidales bacterium]